MPLELLLDLSSWSLSCFASACSRIILPPVPTVLPSLKASAPSSGAGEARHCITA